MSDRPHPRPSSGKTSRAATPPACAAWPVPQGVPVLLFGGSFDPPHRAHTSLSLAARDAVTGPGGWLVVVPAARSPHKQSGPSASDQDRIDMLRAAYAGEPRVAIWTDEIERARADEPSYWADTLARVPQDQHTARAKFLIGADQALSFGWWCAHERILGLAEPVVILREPAGSRERFAAMLRDAGQGKTGLDVDAWLARVIDLELEPETSTDVRELLRAGHHDRAGAHLSPAVFELIRTRGLYGEPAGGGA